MNKIKFKQTLAREVIIFFLAIALIALIFGFLLLRNNYYNNRISSYGNKTSLLKSELDSILKETSIKFPSNESSTDYVNKTFKVMQVAYGKEFILDDKTFRSKIQSDPNYANKVYQVMQYKYGDEFTLDIQTFYDKIGLKKGQLGILPKLPDGFTLVEDKAREHKLHQAFLDFDVTIKAKPKLSKTDIFNKFPEFNNDTAILKVAYTYSALLKEKEINEQTLSNAYESHLDKRDIKLTLFWIALFIVIIIYPLRICYALIRWAYRTLKEGK